MKKYLLISISIAILFFTACNAFVTNNASPQYNFMDILNVTTLTLNFVFLTFFLIIIKVQPGKNEFIFVLLLVIAVSGLHILLLISPVVNNLIHLKIFSFLYLLSFFFFMMAVQIYFADIIKKISIILAILLIIVSLLIYNSSDIKFFFSLTSKIVIISTFVFSAYAFIIFCISLYKDPYRYWFFLFGAIPLAVSSSKLSYYIFISKFDNTPITFLLYLPLSFFILMIFMILDFQNLQKDNLDLTKALLKKTRKLKETEKLLGNKKIKDEPREIIHSVIEYLNENYHETYDRKLLAKKFNLNEDYIGQIFKKTTGINISNYINTKRLEAVKQLLLESDGKVIDIAYHVGFENLTHFYRLFKKEIGVTPKEFKKSYSVGS